MKESWENIWAEGRDCGILRGIGRAMASKSDLQYLVFRELSEWCFLESDSRILEIGCGTAPVPGMLRGISDLVFGVDVSLSSAKVSSTLCLSAVSDGRELPFPDDSFHTVFSTGVLDLYNEDEVRGFFREIQRVLKPGGRSVAVTSSSRCRLHFAVMEYLRKRGRWRYGPKRSFTSLANLLPDGLAVLSEHERGAVFQFRFVSYLFENRRFLRRVYNGLFLCASMVLRPLNRLPGALLVTITEKK